MWTEVIEYVGTDGLRIPCTVWRPERQRPRLVVQVLHGMTEHIGRYAFFAQALTEKGIAVAGVDLRGHGHYYPKASCATFGRNGWEQSLEDLDGCQRLLRQCFKEVPQVLMGFSLGSFLVREYLNQYAMPFAGAIIMGTGHQPSPVLSALKMLVQGQIDKVGFDHTSPLVQKLSFEMYNKKFAPNTTAFDWLCADTSERSSYEQDPLCKESISAGLFWQLLDAMQRTGRKGAYDHWPKNLPVLLLSGADDPVGDGGKGVERVAQQMQKAGLTQVETVLLPGARHDVLHEKESGNAEKAMEIIEEFLDQCVK